LLDLNEYVFDTFNLMKHDLILIDKFEIHDNPLDEWRNRECKNDLYVKNAGWNVQK
jgi:hypothetical protein